MYASGSASGLKTFDFSMAGMLRQNSVVACSGMSPPELTPHLARDVDHQAQFGCLLTHLDVVAMEAARKSALRRERQLLERRMPCCLVDAPLDRILRLQRAQLGGDQAQHHDLALGQEAQWTEVAAALVVVFQEVGVHLHL